MNLLLKTKVHLMPSQNDTVTDLIITVLVAYHMRQIDRLNAVLDALGQPLTLTKPLEDFAPHPDETPAMAVSDFTHHILDTVEAQINQPN
jgi:hypothetical protein